MIPGSGMALMLALGAAVDGYVVTPSSVSMNYNDVQAFTVTNHYADGTSGGTPAIAPDSITLLSGVGTLSASSGNSFTYQPPSISSGGGSATIRVRNTTLGYTTDVVVNYSYVAPSIGFSRQPAPHTVTATIALGDLSDPYYLIVNLYKTGGVFQDVYSNSGFMNGSGSGQIVVGYGSYAGSANSGNYPITLSCEVRRGSGSGPIVASQNLVLNTTGDF